MTRKQKTPRRSCSLETGAAVTPSSGGGRPREDTASGGRVDRRGAATLNRKTTSQGEVTGSRSVVSDSLQPHGLYSPWNSPGQNTGVGSLSLLQGIFPTQESNQGLLNCRQFLYQLSYQGSPNKWPSEAQHNLLSYNTISKCKTLLVPDMQLHGFSIHGIFQARILEWVAISFSNA